MRRSGGKSGRPLGHLPIEALEGMARANAEDAEELLILKSELGYRSTKRAGELADLVSRLLRALKH